MKYNNSISSINEGSSRYVKGGITEQYTTRLGWWERSIFIKQSSDIPFTITPKYEYRPDLVSNDLYGRDDLGWFIMQYNNLIDVNEEFILGTTLTLPSASRITYYLN